MFHFGAMPWTQKVDEITGVNAVSESRERLGVTIFAHICGREFPQELH